MTMVSNKPCRVPRVLSASAVTVAIAISCSGVRSSCMSFRLQQQASRSEVLATSRSCKSDNAEKVWEDALRAERDRSVLLTAKVSQRGRAGLPSTSELLDKIDKLKEIETLLKGSDNGILDLGDAFRVLRGLNDEVQASLSSLESFPEGLTEALPGVAVNLTVLPPVQTSERGLVARAAHVRVALPLGAVFAAGPLDALGPAWGCDITPLFDDIGRYLFIVVAKHPLDGWQLENSPGPTLPGAEGGVASVAAVERGSQAAHLGILAGDVLRAVSFMAPASFKVMGFSFGEAGRIKKVLKCDGAALLEVEEALVSNAESPDSKVTLLLERPPGGTAK